MLKVRDFQCQECGKEFEKFIKTDEKVECPFCGTTNTKAQISASAFKVSGQGAYDQRMKT